jgi:transposase
MEVDMARFDLMDFEWPVIQPLLPNKPRGGVRVDDRARVKRDILTAADWHDLG